MHPNLKQLSYSSDNLLHRCARKYELYKLLPKPDVVEGDEHLDFGSLLGIGVQEMLIHGNVSKARWKMFLSWKNILDADEGEKSKKTFWHAMYAVERFKLYQATVLNRYKLAFIDNKPAIELGFIIDLGDGFKYRGFIDAVMIDTRENSLIVFENKTTKFSNIHEAIYKNSGQALGYSLILDAISQILHINVGSSYKVIYTIYKTIKLDYEIMHFIKSHMQRALWIKQLLLSRKEVTEYAADNYFPMDGQSCYDFFRPCAYFGICELSNENLIGDTGKIKEKTEDESKYQFKFNLQDLIEAQLAKQEGVL